MARWMVRLVLYPRGTPGGGGTDWEAQVEDPCQSQDSHCGLQWGRSLTFQGGLAPGRAPQQMNPTGAPPTCACAPRTSRRPGCPASLPEGLVAGGRRSTKHQFYCEDGPWLCHACCVLAWRHLPWPCCGHWGHSREGAGQAGMWLLGHIWAVQTQLPQGKFTLFLTSAFLADLESSGRVLAKF